MIQAVLFDLDGTLLPIDTDEFLNRYFKLLTQRMQSHLEPKIFMKELLAATSAMINNDDPELTNEQVFIDSFFTATGLSAKQTMPIFEGFYADEYCQLGSYFRPNQLVKKIVKATQEKGYKIVLATNPLFPLIAIEERMRWAGIDEFDFDLITSYEKMHACKPNLAYYKEISDRIGVSPENCLMVGNDVEEDLVASELGMQTFLVEDYLLNRSAKSIKADHQGNLEDLFKFVTTL